MLQTNFEYPIIMVGVISLIMVLLGVVVILGKGDKLISGYNTASEEEKAKFNIKRLRWLVALACWMTAIFTMSIVFFGGNTLYIALSTVSYVVIVIALIVCCNTWAKNK